MRHIINRYLWILQPLNKNCRFFRSIVRQSAQSVASVICWVIRTDSSSRCCSWSNASTMRTHDSLAAFPEEEALAKKIYTDRYCPSVHLHQLWSKSDSWWHVPSLSIDDLRRGKGSLHAASHSSIGQHHSDGYTADLRGFSTGSWHLIICHSAEFDRSVHEVRCQNEFHC